MTYEETIARSHLCNAKTNWVGYRCIKPLGHKWNNPHDPHVSEVSVPRKERKMAPVSSAQESRVREIHEAMDKAMSAVGEMLPTQYHIRSIGVRRDARHNLKIDFKAEITIPNEELSEPVARVGR